MCDAKWPRNDVSLAHIQRWGEGGSCYHIVAARTAVGIVDDGVPTCINLTQLLRNKRKHHHSFSKLSMKVIVIQAYGRSHIKTRSLIVVSNEITANLQTPGMMCQQHTIIIILK